MPTADALIRLGFIADKDSLNKVVEESRKALEGTGVPSSHAYSASNKALNAYIDALAKAVKQSEQLATATQQIAQSTQSAAQAQKQFSAAVTQTGQAKQKYAIPTAATINSPQLLASLQRNLGVTPNVPTAAANLPMSQLLPFFVQQLGGIPVVGAQQYGNKMLAPKPSGWQMAQQWYAQNKYAGAYPIGPIRQSPPPPVAPKPPPPPKPPRPPIAGGAGFGGQFAQGATWGMGRGFMGFGMGRALLQGAGFAAGAGTVLLAAKAFKELASAIGEAGKATAEYLVDATKLAARVETLGIAVENVGKIYGYMPDQMAEFEKQITKQNITTQAARQSMLYMAEAEIDFSKGAELARIAQDAAVISGQNSSEAFQDMVWAIQRGEPRMLRRLGIAVSFERAYTREAHAMNKSVQELTEYEKGQIRVNEVIATGSRLAGTYEAAMNTAGKRLTSLPRVFEQIKLSIGNAFLKAASEGIFRFYDAMVSVQKWLEDNQGLIEDFGEALGSAFKNALDLASKLSTIKFPEITGAISGMTEFLDKVALYEKTVEKLIELNRKANPPQQQKGMPVPDVLAGAGKRSLLGLNLLGPLAPIAAPLAVKQSWDDLLQIMADMGIADKDLVKQFQSLSEISKPLTQEFVKQTEAAMGLAQAEINLGKKEKELAAQRKTITDFAGAWGDIGDSLQKYRDEASNARLIADKDYQEKLVKLGLAWNDRLIQIDIDAARKREDIWKDYWQKLEDIARENSQKVADAAVDLTREQQDALQKHLDNEADLDKDNAQKRIDIEKDYQRQLRQIRDDFAFDAEEFIRQRDAIGYLRLMREAAKKRQDAAKDRRDQQADADKDFKRNKEAEEKRWEREQRDLKIQYDRKLEDLIKALAREREEAAIARDRAIADAAEDQRRAHADELTKLRNDLRDLEKERTDAYKIAEDNLQKHIDIEGGKLRDLISKHANAANQIAAMWENLGRAFGLDITIPRVATTGGWQDVGVGRTGSNVYNGVPSGGNANIYGAGGLVTASLTNSTYSPPAMPITYGNLNPRAGNSHIGIDINLNGAGVLDAEGRSQLLVMVKEVVQNSLPWGA